MTHKPPMDTAPSLLRLIGETAVVGDWLRGRRAAPAIARGHDGGGRPVLVIPGFMTSDMRTRTLRRTLARGGYAPHGWEMGRNRGVSEDLLDRLGRRLAQIATGGKASLIGWSLGGLFARELAKRRPDLVDRVITLGSPFSGDPRANNVWRMYEWIAGHPVDQPPIEARLHEKPPVPTWALWSRKDGLVAPFATRGLPGESDVAVEVDCRHTGFTVAPSALRAILAALESPLQPVSRREKERHSPSSPIAKA